LKKKSFFVVLFHFTRTILGGFFSNYKGNPEMLHYNYGGWLIFDALMRVLKCTFIAGRRAVATGSEIN